MNGKNILVLGQGVTGLTAAWKLLAAGHQVTIWSKEASGQFPNTSSSAYAMWVPVKVDSDPRIERWTNETYAELAALAGDSKTGVVMRRIVVLKSHKDEPWFSGQPWFRHGQGDEVPAGYADANVYDKAPVVDPLTYLPWLHAQVVAAGGKFDCKTVERLSDCPAEFDFVINCTGLGSRKLAADQTLVPERVQVITVKANGFDRVVIDDDGPNKRACIVPHGSYIKLGGVFDGAQEGTEVEAAHTRDILERCKKMVPGFSAELVDVQSQIRAVRPERSLPRVELDKSSGRAIVHNYGHDGMGYLLSLGIGNEVVALVAAG